MTKIVKNFDNDRLSKYKVENNYKFFNFLTLPRMY